MKKKPKDKRIVHRKKHKDDLLTRGRKKKYVDVEARKAGYKDRHARCR